MDEYEKGLLIEVHVEAGDQHRNLTGYPIAPNRILTARHGLLPDLPADDKRIRVRWHAQDNRCWRRARILWQDADLDAAVLLCRFPRELTHCYRLVCDHPLTDDMRWSGVGIAEAAARGQQTGPYDFQGRVYAPYASRPRFSLGIDDACDQHEWYEGASGMAVFVGQRIVGVAVARDPAAPTHRFLASPVRQMLKAPAFRRAIDHDRRVARRQRAAERLVARLTAPDGQALCERLRGPLNCPTGSAEVIAGALLDADLDLLLKTLDGYVKAAPAGGANAARNTVATLLGDLLPVVYDPGAVAGLAGRVARPDAWCLEVPAGLATAGEVIMAGLRARPVWFKALASRDQDPQPRDRLESPPEAGPDEDGSDYVRDVERDLASQVGLSADAALARTEQDRAALRTGIKDELRWRAEEHHRHFYLLLEHPGRDQLPAHVRAALRTLHGIYHETVDFGVLALAHDIAARNQERNRLRRLRLLYLCETDTRP